MGITYWTYLTNSKYWNDVKNLNPNPLTFEQVSFNNSVNSDSFIVKLKSDYTQLIKDGFFDGFKCDYDHIFISTFAPSERPLLNNKICKIELV